MYYFATVPPLGNLYIEKNLLSEGDVEYLFVAIDEKKNRYLGVCTANYNDIDFYSWIIMRVDADEVLLLMGTEEDYRILFSQKGRDKYLISYSEDLGIYTKMVTPGMSVALLPALRLDQNQVQFDRAYLEELMRAAAYTYHIEDDGTLISRLNTKECGQLHFTGKVEDREYLCEDQDGITYYAKSPKKGHWIIYRLDDSDSKQDSEYLIVNESSSMSVLATESSMKFLES